MNQPKANRYIVEPKRKNAAEVDVFAHTFQVESGCLVFYDEHHHPFYGINADYWDRVRMDGQTTPADSNK